MPFAERGRNADIGLDCWGLVIELYRRLCGIDLPGYLDAYESVKPEPAATAVALGVQSWAQTERPEPLDVAIFNVCGYPCHTAVMLGADRFVHADPRAGVVIERVSDLTWCRRLRGYFYYTQPA